MFRNKIFLWAFAIACGINIAVAQAWLVAYLIAWIEVRMQ